MGLNLLTSVDLQVDFLWSIADASKSGVAQETVQNIRRASKIMAEPEARQILGVTEHSTWEEILQVKASYKSISMMEIIFNYGWNLNLIVTAICVSLLQHELEPLIGQCSLIKLVIRS